MWGREYRSCEAQIANDCEKLHIHLKYFGPTPFIAVPEHIPLEGISSGRHSLCAGTVTLGTQQCATDKKHTWQVARGVQLRRNPPRWQKNWGNCSVPRPIRKSIETRCLLKGQRMCSSSSGAELMLAGLKNSWSISSISSKGFPVESDVKDLRLISWRVTARKSRQYWSRRTNGATRYKAAYAVRRINHIIKQQ